MVYLGELMSPTSTIITAEVIGVFQQLAGDFYQTLPFALLTARNYFHHQSYLNPSDSDENECRKLACEVLARKIVAKTKMEEQYCLLSARYTLILNGEETLPTSGQSMNLLSRSTVVTSMLMFYLLDEIQPWKAQ